jgi:hypothetical protein
MAARKAGTLRGPGEAESAAQQLALGAMQAEGIVKSPF